MILTERLIIVYNVRGILMGDTLKPDYPAERKILNAAREVFAEKGYEGASISEIAKRAGVNKALPFYYFESKEKLLKEVVRLGARETIQRKNLFMNHADSFAKEAMEEYFEQVLTQLEARKEIVKILLMESLKGSGESNLLFEFLDPVFQELLDKFKHQGIQPENPQELLSAELFFNAIPLFTFTVLAEQWAHYKSIDTTAVKEDFVRSFKQIYIDYFYKKYFEKVRK